VRTLVIARAASLSAASVLMFATGSFFIGHAQQADSRSAYVLFDTSPVVLKNVRVIDGTGAPAKEEQTIVIEDGRIRAIGDPDTVLAPATGRSVDLRGRTVLPGLVMVHEHFQYRTGNEFSHAQPFSYPRLFLAYGVTTVRTAGTLFPYMDLNLKREIAEGRVPGPEMHVTGPYFDGGARVFNEVLWGTKIIRDPDDGRRAVRYWATEGVTSFKLYASISKSAAEAIIDEAHRHGLMVTGHLGSLTCEEAADLGIDNIEHATVCAREARGKGASAEYALMRKLAQSKVALTLTFLNNRPLSDRELEMLHPEARDAYLRSAAERSSRQGPGAGTFMPLYQEFVRNGGLLVLGSDAGGSPGWGWFAGPSNHRAVETLVKIVGFPPVQAIRIATLNGATLLRVENRIGSIAAGKQADLFVVRGNPAANIEDIEHVEMVFKKGIAYDPEALRTAVKGQVGWH
jgi:imidazolonepropionase-like amidohydrolase